VSTFLDTHALVALHDGRVDVFGTASRRLLETQDLRWSPAVHLELALLYEIGRLTLSPDLLLQGVVAQFGATMATEPFGAVAASAARLTWTRDPFDRLITAHASLDGSPLVTRDRRITEHYPHAVW
jgi:PIN domain nuclease of toxin-antitoxin system